MNNSLFGAETLDTPKIREEYNGLDITPYGSETETRVGDTLRYLLDSEFREDYEDSPSFRLELQLRRLMMTEEHEEYDWSMEENLYDQHLTLLLDERLFPRRINRYRFKSPKAKNVPMAFYRLMQNNVHGTVDVVKSFGMVESAIVRKNTSNKRRFYNMRKELPARMLKRGMEMVYRSGMLDTVLLSVSTPVLNTIGEMVDEKLFCSFVVAGHHDTFISKATAKILIKYLYPKYGNKIIMNVDPNFAMCSVSMEKAKKTVLALPELVNKTVRTGIYTNILDKHGTRLTIIKNPIYNESDISANGISSSVKNFKTTIVFTGPLKKKWMKHIMNQIDTLCSKMVTTSTTSDKIRVNNLSSQATKSTDIQIRPLQYLTFPKKDSLLADLQKFISNGKIYKENGIPHRLGLLFTGPRGVGKTSTAFSLAQEFGMDCVAVDLSYFDKESGSDAFNESNTIYIIDEIDAQLPKFREGNAGNIITEDQQKMRDRLIKLLRAMDEMSGGSIIIATTNFPENLDTALTRSGRFDRIVDFGDLSRDWAVTMVQARDLDPEYVLKNEHFPINPAYLEQLIVNKILEKNDIALRQEVDVESLMNEEYGHDEDTFAAWNDRIDDEDAVMKALSSDLEDKPLERISSDSDDAVCVDDDEDDDE